MNQMLSPESTMSPRDRHVITSQTILLIHCPRILSGTNISLADLQLSETKSASYVLLFLFQTPPLRSLTAQRSRSVVKKLPLCSHPHVPEPEKPHTSAWWHVIRFISLINYPQILGFHWPAFLPLKSLRWREHQSRTVLLSLWNLSLPHLPQAVGRLLPYSSCLKELKLKPLL